MTVIFTHDEFLRNVYQTTGEVARVSSTQCSVDEALTSTRCRNEVFECFESFTEVALDRAWNHVTTRVCHEAAHSGNLTHLRHVSACTRSDHHVNRVELLGFKCRFHRCLNFCSGICPNTNFLLTALAVCNDSALELRLHFFGLFFVAVKNCTLCSRRLDVVDRHSQTRLRCIAIANGFHGIK